ncbi:MAG: bifunctional histidinol-phosphatase/imidazoleglycerol-phosphate dehydratase HisB [Pantoea sp. Brub]|nr:bifunctional histidinol-phosphatase/imidazoleglycerol-phosphate dehydratase HisB [Pantoea sp. Brub]
MKQKTLFIDRDGTIIAEPAVNFQVDTFNKLAFEPYVIPALLNLQSNGYHLIMITNQDGLGTSQFPQSDFDGPHNLMIQVLTSQGIMFDDILICPHTVADNCDCRKPKIKMVAKWLGENIIDIENSYVIGDRLTDVQLAKNMNIKSILYNKEKNNWISIQTKLLNNKRYALVKRNTTETNAYVEIWLNIEGDNKISTGIKFFDHMLEQIALHGGFKLHIKVTGDLDIDDHHTVEDTALTLGKALKESLGNKFGIGRFGFFVIPMDESLAHCILDISGRPYLKFKAKFKNKYVGDLNTDMVEHFFSSIANTMMSTIHIKAKGKNDHHCVESIFKAFGRTLRQAMCIEGQILPSSKGLL